MDLTNKVYIYAIPPSILSGSKRLGSDQPIADLADLLDLPSEDEEADDDDEKAQVEGSASSSSSTRGVGKELSSEEDSEASVRHTAGSPITWFTSPKVPPPTKLGIYSTMLPSQDSTPHSLQLQQAPTKSNSSEGERTIAMIMLGGGHFQGTIISLNESSVSKCAIKASKGFHRYTTRRKQGGSQSANDNAKGAANSAGAQIRRYNEIALAQDIQSLLLEWKKMLEDVELILIRASGQSSRKLLYENGLHKGDPRIRGFPLNTRRATQSEIIRCFHILTRLQVGSTDDDKVQAKPIVKKEIAKPTPPEIKADPVIVQQTDQLAVLIKRNKIPGLKAFLAEKNIDVCKFRLEPRKTYGHTPTLLHFASSSNSALVVGTLLDQGADPTERNGEDQTPFELASAKATRDAFRLWRGKAGGEQAWDWDAAKVPVGLTAEQVNARKAKESEEQAAEEAAEAERRRQEMERLQLEAQEAQQKAQLEADRKRGPGRSLASGILGPSSISSLDGLTPEMAKKIERERRARAAEARFGKK